MTLFLKRALYFGILIESVLFVLFYFFGPNGLHVLDDLSDQKKVLIAEISQHEQKVKDLQRQLATSQTGFAKETMARERLLMKKDNEQVFFKTSMKDKKHV